MVFGQYGGFVHLYLVNIAVLIFTHVVNSILETTGESWFSYPGPYEWTTYASRFGYPFSCLIGYTIMLPHVFVRSAYSGDDLRTQRKVMWITPLLQALVWSLTFLIGAVGIAALPGMDSSVTEMIIPYIVENIINPVNGGLATVLMILFFIGAARRRHLHGRLLPARWRLRCL